MTLQRAEAFLMVHEEMKELGAIESEEIWISIRKRMRRNNKNLLSVVNAMFQEKKFSEEEAWKNKWPALRPRHKDVARDLARALQNIGKGQLSSAAIDVHMARRSATRGAACEVRERALFLVASVSAILRERLEEKNKKGSEAHV